jgi:hypothetical protein
LEDLLETVGVTGYYYPPASQEEIDDHFNFREEEKSSADGKKEIIPNRNEQSPDSNLIKIYLKELSIG